MSSLKGWEEAGRQGRRERPILFSGPMVRAIIAGQKTQTRRVVSPQPVLIDAKGGGKIWHLKTRTGFANSDTDGTWPAWMTQHHKDQDGNVYPAVCPYGAPGDRLWVRETWGLHLHGDYTCWMRDPIAGRTEDDIRTSWEVAYMADATSPYDHWRPSIHMPRWASRLTLDVTEVRVQRLQEISEEDARAEGVEPVVHEHWTAYDPETEGYPSFGVEPDAEMIARKRLENVRHHGPKVLSTARQQFDGLWQSINGERQGCSWDDNPWVWAISFKRLP